MTTRPEQPIWLKLGMAACFSICIGVLSFVLLNGGLR